MLFYRIFGTSFAIRLTQIMWICTKNLTTMKRFFILACLLTGTFVAQRTFACTGITLHSVNNHPVTARTIEWAATPLHTMYVVVPRGQAQQSILPDGSMNGKRFTAKYGYVGIAVEETDFIMEGINETGLGAGLFYFPQYGEYQPYDSTYKDQSVSDMQLVAWILSNFATINELQAGMNNIRVIGTDPRASTVHWRITEPNGRQVVLEIINQQVRFYENPLGVLTNSPEFTWHLTNLNNYVNLSAGSINHRQVGTLDLNAFGGGSGLHGLPGDMTPPSRFIRAAFFQSTAPRLGDEDATAMQAFHLLNHFDIPVGIQFADPRQVPSMPSATQVTIASDLHNQRLFYRTMYDSSIRCIDLRDIDFKRVKFQFAALDTDKRQPIEEIKIR
jgi:choloylglycine hydrolase